MRACQKRMDARAPMDEVFVYHLSGPILCDHIYHHLYVSLCTNNCRVHFSERIRTPYTSAKLLGRLYACPVHWRTHTKMASTALINRHAYIANVHAHAQYISSANMQSKGQGGHLGIIFRRKVLCGFPCSVKYPPAAVYVSVSTRERLHNSVNMAPRPLGTDYAQTCICKYIYSQACTPVSLQGPWL